MSLVDRTVKKTAEEIKKMTEKEKRLYFLCQECNFNFDEFMKDINKDG